MSLGVRVSNHLVRRDINFIEPLGSLGKVDILYLEPKVTKRSAKPRLTDLVLVLTLTLNSAKAVKSPEA